MIGATQGRDVVRLRHELHARPSPSGDEHATREILQAWLEERGIATQTIAGTGLLAHRPGQGPPVLCRADLDALPLTEASGVAHASSHPGLHHACGHDGHMAMLAGALAHAPEGPDVWALFQPAEETGEGMRACLADGALDKDWHRVWAIHNVPGHPLGEVLVRPNVMALASTGLALRFEGATSHAAEPEKARNAAYAISEVVPRVGPSLAPPGDTEARASIVGIECGGPRFGTTAGTGTLWVTLRASSDAGLASMRQQLCDAAQAASEPHGLRLDVRDHEPFPATVNDAQAVHDVRVAAKAAGLPTATPELPFPWSEDFGHATARWSGALVGLGSGEATPSLHAPEFDFPDALLPKGIDLWQQLMACQ